MGRLGSAAEMPWSFRVFGGLKTFGLAGGRAVPDCTDLAAADLAAADLEAADLAAADLEADTADATAASTSAAFKRLALTLSATTSATANTMAKNATASAATVTSSMLLRAATQYPHFFKGRSPTASAWPETASLLQQQSPP